MYCQECGKRNEQDAIFCEFCGSKIELPSNDGYEDLQTYKNYNNVDEAYANDHQKTPEIDVKNKISADSRTDKGGKKQNHTNKDTSKKRRKRKPGFIRRFGVLIAQLVLCAILITTFIIIGKNSTSPEKIAEQYFEEVAKGNWSVVYNYLQPTESDFISEELFLKSNANTKQINYQSYKVGEGVQTAQDGGKDVTISYYEADNPNVLYYTIHLEKSGKSKLLFFPEWIVSISDNHVSKHELSKFTTPNVGFEIPAGYSITVDGILLGDEYAGKGNGETVNYIVPLMFSGEHLLQMSADNMEDYREIVFIPSAEEYQYYGEALGVKEEILQILFDKACTNLKNIYSAGMNREDFIKIQYLFSEEEGIQAAMNAAYSDFAGKLCNEEGFGLKNIDFKNIKGNMVQGYYDNQAVIKVQLTMDYSCTSQINNVVDGSYENVKKEGTQYVVEFGFVSEKDNWVLKECSFNLVEY